MRSEFRSLRLKQLDRSLESFRAAQSGSRPQKGWIRAVREALGVSAAELGRILGSSRQLPLQFEKAEAKGSITLKSLRSVAKALDCDLIYALVPKAGTMQALIEGRARAQARKHVLAWSTRWRLKIRLREESTKRWKRRPAALPRRRGRQ